MSINPSRYINLLPGEAGPADTAARQTPGACWSSAQPGAVSNPSMIAWNQPLADSLDLSADWQDPAKQLQWLSGNALPPGSQPYAMCYGGHQFGQWAGQLGDGRVINLGDVPGKDLCNWTLQLKGAGPTAYSRFADGRAVLRSSVREYLCSEAMAYLGVATTRALSLVLTGDTVVRDVFYDGHPAPEPGAIVCRASPSFLRFGHFELAASQNNAVLLKQLLHYALTECEPGTGAGNASDNASSNASEWVASFEQHIPSVLVWFEALCEKTLALAVDWARVGFVHGVLNTDNMSALGLTIDYGPYGWLDAYDPAWTPNTTDAGQRRYRFENQGRIVQWNLYQLANALAVVVPDHEALQSIIESLPDRYAALHQQMMCHKLGLEQYKPGVEKLLTLLENLLQAQETDMTLFFSGLKHFPGPQISQAVADTGHDSKEQYSAIQNSEHQDSGKQDAEICEDLLRCIADSLYDGRALDENLPLYRQFALEYCRALAGIDPTVRQQLMSATNPAFILRNYLVQQAIEALNNGDRAPFESLQVALKSPYQDQGELSQKRPEWARNHPGCTALSCSS